MTFATELEGLAFLAQIKAHAEAEGKSTDLVAAPTTHGYWTIVSPRELAEPPKTCAICLQSFHEFSANADPVFIDGRCCAYCDEHVVTPARLRIAEQISWARGEQVSEEHGVAIIFGGVTGEAMQRIHEEAARRGVSEDDVVDELLKTLSARPPDEQLVLCNPGEEEVDEERARLNGQILTELAMKYLPPGTLQ